MSSGSDAPGTDCIHARVAIRREHHSVKDVTYSDMFENICRDTPWCVPEVFEASVELAIEIAREGREGRRIGTLFTLGRHELVLPRARPLILDPLSEHPRSKRSVHDPNLRGTVKELAQLDGAFIVDDKGIFVGACRYLDTSTTGIELGLGLGSRHWAAASCSRETGAIAIVVSESAVVRIFKHGRLHAEILPELWLISRYGGRGHVERHAREQVAIVTPNE